MLRGPELPSLWTAVLEAPSLEAAVTRLESVFPRAFDRFRALTTIAMCVELSLHRTVFVGQGQVPPDPPADDPQAQGANGAGASAAGAPAPALRPAGPLPIQFPSISLLAAVRRRLLHVLLHYARAPSIAASPYAHALLLYKAIYTGYTDRLRQPEPQVPALDANGAAAAARGWVAYYASLAASSGSAPASGSAAAAEASAVPAPAPAPIWLAYPQDYVAELNVLVEGLRVLIQESNAAQAARPPVADDGAMVLADVRALEDLHRRSLQQPQPVAIQVSLSPEPVTSLLTSLIGAGVARQSLPPDARFRLWPVQAAPVPFVPPQMRPPLPAADSPFAASATGGGAGDAGGATAASASPPRSYAALVSAGSGPGAAAQVAPLPSKAEAQRRLLLEFKQADLDAAADNISKAAQATVGPQTRAQLSSVLSKGGADAVAYLGADPAFVGQLLRFNPSVAAEVIDSVPALSRRPYVSVVRNADVSLQSIQMMKALGQVSGMYQAVAQDARGAGNGNGNGTGNGASSSGSGNGDSDPSDDGSQGGGPGSISPAAAGRALARPDAGIAYFDDAGAPVRWIDVVKERLVASMSVCSSGPKGSAEKSRMARLLCVYLQSLMPQARGVLLSMRHEVSAFCVDFLTVREAQELYQLLNSGDSQQLAGE